MSRSGRCEESAVSEGGSVSDGAAAGARPAAASRHRAVALACTLFVFGMVGAAYASVPLYRLFCQVTGFGGATKVATEAPAASIARTMQIHFDSNVAPGLNVDFTPVERNMRVQVGATTLATYRVRNRTQQPQQVLASYNVTPEVTGYYFSKIQCFCFNEITLKPGEQVDLPVVFFVEPSIAEDKTLDRIGSITLSYTLFAAKQPARPVAEAGSPRPRL
jgi:cytochrome c oxidase assembly protein subunit 11